MPAWSGGEKYALLGDGVLNNRDSRGFRRLWKHCRIGRYDSKSAFRIVPDLVRCVASEWQKRLNLKKSVILQG